MSNAVLLFRGKQDCLRRCNPYTFYMDNIKNRWGQMEQKERFPTCQNRQAASVCHEILPDGKVGDGLRPMFTCLGNRTDFLRDRELVQLVQLVQKGRRLMRERKKGIAP